jgi:hypothetical protein
MLAGDIESGGFGPVHGLICRLSGNDGEKSGKWKKLKL